MFSLLEVLFILIKLHTFLQTTKAYFYYYIFDNLIFFYLNIFISSSILRLNQRHNVGSSREFQNGVSKFTEPYHAFYDVTRISFFLTFFSLSLKGSAVQASKVICIIPTDIIIYNGNQQTLIWRNYCSKANTFSSCGTLGLGTMIS